MSRIVDIQLRRLSQLLEERKITHRARPGGARVARRQGLRSGLRGAAVEARDPEGGAGPARRADPVGQGEGRREPSRSRSRRASRASPSTARRRRARRREARPAYQLEPALRLSRRKRKSQRWLPIAAVTILKVVARKTDFDCTKIQIGIRRNLSPQSPLSTATEVYRSSRYFLSKAMSESLEPRRMAGEGKAMSLGGMSGDAHQLRRKCVESAGSSSRWARQRGMSSISGGPPDVMQSKKKSGIVRSSLGEMNLVEYPEDE